MRDRLIELLCGHYMNTTSDAAEVAEYLLENGVIVAPMPMANWLREELTEYVHKRCVEEL